ncbi:MAG: radical SAM protein [bacterium]|nr:radical SAM protein [bacterium]
MKKMLSSLPEKIMSITGFFLGIVGFVFTIVLHFIKHSIIALFVAVVIVFSLLLVYYSLHLIRERREKAEKARKEQEEKASKSQATLYPNWDIAPRQYHMKETYTWLSKNTATLQIVARTSFRMLCGDERLLNPKDSTPFDEQKKEIQAKICDALQNKSNMIFVFQNPLKQIPWLTKEEEEKEITHYREAQKSVNEIKEQLIEKKDIEAAERLQLRFTDELVLNSMLRILKEKTTERFVLDLGFKFKEDNATEKPRSKPFVVFPSHPSGVDEFDKALTSIIANSFERDVNVMKGKEEIKKLIEKYNHFSPLRNDTSSTLTDFYIQNRKSATVAPPRCVQLLITHQCTTECKICSHYNLFQNTNQELTGEDIKNIIDYIYEMKTRSIIISGGEPLSRPKDFFDILDHIKTKEYNDLNVGVMTNGIKKANNTLSAVTLEDARKIAQVCSWVQLSISSFNSKTYSKIHKPSPHMHKLDMDLFSIPLESLKNLSAVSKEGFRIEVCVPIQRDNCHELESIETEIEKLNLPNNVSIRFKFPHAVNKDEDFLCTRDQLQKVVKNLQNITRNKRFNADYLISMILEKHMDIELIGKGKPLEKKMASYHETGYICHILKLMCTIDAEGNLYPCVYLFDDNVAAFSKRNEYKIASLRGEVPITAPLNAKAPNPLKNIWEKNEKLNKLREMQLPICEASCHRCTRHFFQNEFLNKLNNIFKKYKAVAGPTELLSQSSTQPKPTWI